MSWREQDYCGDEYPEIKQEIDQEMLDICQNQNCTHPFCPEHSEVEIVLWP